MKALLSLIDVYVYLRRECKWPRKRALCRAWQCI